MASDRCPDACTAGPGDDNRTQTPCKSGGVLCTIVGLQDDLRRGFRTITHLDDVDRSALPETGLEQSPTGAECKSDIVNETYSKCR